jgi:hypothetical protein
MFSFMYCSLELELLQNRNLVGTIAFPSGEFSALAQIPLDPVGDRSDESWGAKSRAERNYTMNTTTEQTSTTTNASAGAQAAHVAPEKTTATTKKASRAAKPATAKQGAKKAAKKSTASKNSAKTKPAAARPASKKQAVLDLLRRKHGATLAEIAKATNWQNHSIRGFISGTISKRMGIKVESTRDEAGERVYRIK